MIGYIDPEAYLLIQPVGIDKAIQNIQTKLQAQLSWLQVAFGRAFRQESLGYVRDSEGKEVRVRYNYPEVYQKTKEPLNVMPNDNLKSACFFYTKDPGKPVDYNFLQYNAYTYGVSLIFWFNLEKIDNTKDFRFTEVLKLEVLQVLRGVTTMKVTEIYENWENILRDFTVGGNTKEYLKPPYSGFRIDFDLSYTETGPNC